MSQRLTGAAFTDLVGRLRADAQRTGNTTTPSAVAAQVDALLLSASRTSAGSQPTATRSTTKERVAMQNTPTKAPKKTRPTTTNRRRTKKPAPPKPRATITLATDLAAEMNDSHHRMPPLQPPGQSRPAVKSAHEVEEPSPCVTCGGEADGRDDRFGPWRRHPDCSRITQMWDRRKAAAEFLTVPITDDEARVMKYAVLPYADVHPTTLYLPDDADRSPWSHVRRSDLVRAVAQAREYLAEVTGMAECASGRCGWCGRLEAEDWRLYGHAWPDGSEAPLCGDCGDVFDRRFLSPSYPEDDRTRAALVEAMTGVQSQMGATGVPGVVAFHEVGHGGDGQPWDHLPADAVESLRWSEWARSNGRYAPPEHRDEAVARRAAQEASRTRAVAHAAQHDRYGFLAGRQVQQEGQKP